MSLLFSTAFGVVRGFTMEGVDTAATISIGTGGISADTRSKVYDWFTTLIGRKKFPTVDDFDDATGGTGGQSRRIIIHGVNGMFRDPLNLHDLSANTAKDTARGTLNITGLAFQSSCDDTSKHGLNSIFEYFDKHRVSKNKRAVTLITIGDMVIPGTIFSLSWGMQDMEFKLWRWTLNMVTPFGTSSEEVSTN